MIIKVLMVKRDHLNRVEALLMSMEYLSSNDLNGLTSARFSKYFI